MNPSVITRWGRRFAGAGTALVTPLDERGGLDSAALKRLVERVVAGGVDYLVCGGTSGEGPFVPSAVRRAMVDRTLEFVAGRLPVVAAVIADSEENAVAQARSLRATDLSGLMVTPPGYYPLSDDELHRFYDAVAHGGEKPIIIYNIPQNARNGISPSLLARLSTDSRFAAIKDSGARDFALHIDLIAAAAHRDDFSVLTGLDRLLLPSLVMGAHGAISPSGNVLPEGCPAIITAFEEGDLDAARRAQDAVAAVLAAVQIGRFPGWWKAGTQAVGIGTARAADLAPHPTDEQAAQIRLRVQAALAAHPFACEAGR